MATYIAASQSRWSSFAHQQDDTGWVWAGNEAPSRCGTLGPTTAQLEPLDEL